jgi:hypothetical protein
MQLQKRDKSQRENQSNNHYFRLPASLLEVENRGLMYTFWFGEKPNPCKCRETIVSY